MASSMAGMQGVSVAECSDYLTQHGIQAAMKECLEKLCRERPANPFRFMKEYFARLEPPVHKKETSIDLFYPYYRSSLGSLNNNHVVATRTGQLARTIR